MGAYHIPPEHWGHHGAEAGQYDFRPAWERQLRQRIAEQPDPAKRFDAWLRLAAIGMHHGAGGIRLWFIEQPYLEWAEAVKQAVETAEKELRELLAYEIEHPDDR